MGWLVNATPRPLYPRERPGTHCTFGWVGPKFRLDGCGKSRSHPSSAEVKERVEPYLYPLCLRGKLLGVRFVLQVNLLCFSNK
jgi:hypothetical protein